jgi:hypothetical protein
MRSAKDDFKLMGAIAVASAIVLPLIYLNFDGLKSMSAKVISKIEGKSNHSNSSSSSSSSSDSDDFESNYPEVTKMLAQYSKEQLKDLASSDIKVHMKNSYKGGYCRVEPSQEPGRCSAKVKIDRCDKYHYATPIYNPKIEVHGELYWRIYDKKSFYELSQELDVIKADMDAEREAKEKGITLPPTPLPPLVSMYLFNIDLVDDTATLGPCICLCLDSDQSRNLEIFMVN